MSHLHVPSVITQPLTITGLHHVQISVPVPMEAAAIAFYGETLGLERVPKPDTLQERGGTWFQLGRQQLHLTVEDGVNRRGTKVHLAYLVDDLAGWRRHMIAHEVTPIDSIPIPGYDRFEARDPFGNRIEFIQKLAG